MYGTLNKVAGNIKSIAPIRRLKLPTCFHKIGYLEDDGVPRHNTVALYCNNGWEISINLSIQPTKKSHYIVNLGLGVYK